MSKYSFILIFFLVSNRFNRLDGELGGLRYYDYGSQIGYYRYICLNN